MVPSLNMRPVPFLSQELAVGPDAVHSNKKTVIY
jgi:hypothetical protein